MAQDGSGIGPDAPSDESVRRIARELAAARLEALREPQTSLDLIRAYQHYQLANVGRLDAAGPGGMITLLEDHDRLVVVGNVIAETAQLDRARSVVARAGGSVVDEENDDDLGVTLLRVGGVETDALFAAVKAAVTDTTNGLEPLAMSLDDVTCQNAPGPPGPILLKSVTLPGSSGAAQLIAMSSPRPTGTGLGAGVRVGVIDGGYAPEGQRRTDGWDDNVVPPPDGRPRLDSVAPGTLDPGAGHGTFVTGLVLRHAPDAEIRQYRATDTYGFGSSWRLKDCIRQAVRDGCRVVNLSLGFTDPDLLGSPALSAALHRVPDDVVVVAAAGNAGTSRPMLPAAHKRVVGVGGLDAGLVPLCWSNRGPWVDFSARALPVISTFVAQPDSIEDDPNRWAVWAGTSFSAPQVSGVLAVLLGRGLSVDAALAAVRAQAVRPHPSPDFGVLLDLPGFPPPGGSP